MLIEHEVSAADVAKKVRELWAALAHCMVKAHPGSPRMELLNRIYLTLSSVDALKCRAELRRCRNAIAFPQEAQVA